jgi:hypothetical protein
MGEMWAKINLTTISQDLENIKHFVSKLERHLDEAEKAPKEKDPNGETVNA